MQRADVKRAPCAPCGDTGWVCEDHQGKPWEGPGACGCGGAGAPCPVCNKDMSDVNMLPDISRVPGGFEIDVIAGEPPKNRKH